MCSLFVTAVELVSANKTGSAIRALVSGCLDSAFSDCLSGSAVCMPSVDFIKGRLTDRQQKHPLPTQQGHATGTKAVAGDQAMQARSYVRHPSTIKLPPYPWVLSLLSDSVFLGLRLHVNVPVLAARSFIRNMPILLTAVLENVSIGGRPGTSILLTVRHRQLPVSSLAGTQKHRSEAKSPHDWGARS